MFTLTGLGRRITQFSSPVPFLCCEISLKGEPMYESGAVIVCGFAFILQGFPSVRDPLTLVRDPLALVRNPVTLVSDPLALV